MHLGTEIQLTSTRHSTTINLGRRHPPKTHAVVFESCHFNEPVIQALRESDGIRSARRAGRPDSHPELTRARGAAAWTKTCN
eukprot:11781650-Alexandrium_andersonii.AAC.1